MISAKEANELRAKNMLNRPNIKGFDLWVGNESRLGHGSGTYHGDLTEEEMEFLCDYLGYSVYWDSVCLWWNVRWDWEK